MCCESGVAGNVQVPDRRTMLDVLKLGFRKYGILEERPNTSTVIISGANQHPFASANLPNRFASFRESRGGSPPGKVFLQVGVFDLRLSLRCEPVGDPEDDEAVAGIGVEDTLAICETAGFFAKFADLHVFSVENEN